MLAVFKIVFHLDDVRVLGHLQHFNFTALLKYLDLLHVLLLHHLNGYLLARFLMRSELDKTELTFSEGILQIVEPEDVSHADSFLEQLQPGVAFSLRSEVQDARLARWEDDLAGVEPLLSVWTAFHVNVLDENIGQTVHDAVLLVRRGPVEVDLVAGEHAPVLLEAVSLGLKEALPGLVRMTILLIIIDEGIVAEACEDDVFRLIIRVH